MKLNFVLPVVLCFLSPLIKASTNQIDVVYGEDGRVEAYARPNLKKESAAVAAMIPRKSLSLETMLGFQIEAPSYEEEFNLCQGDKFASQPVFADCSGFLVGPDTLMTAGHCVRSMNDCRESDWVFGYEMSPEGNPAELDRNNVYQCTAILSHPTPGLDYAIIKLDRKTNREPLKLAAFNLMAPPGTNLYMIGYPSGLPLKITEGGQILRNERHLLVTNLDAFSGNSGSPVLDVVTHLVVGILVSGNDDYVETSRGCSNTNKMNMAQGGETVTSIGVVPRNF